jgi:hypothetical protein
MTTADDDPWDRAARRVEGLIWPFLAFWRTPPVGLPLDVHSRCAARSEYDARSARTADATDNGL